MRLVNDIQFITLCTRLETEVFTKFVNGLRTIQELGIVTARIQGDTDTIKQIMNEYELTNIGVYGEFTNYAHKGPHLKFIWRYNGDNITNADDFVNTNNVVDMVALLYAAVEQETYSPINKVTYQRPVVKPLNLTDCEKTINDQNIEKSIVKAPSETSGITTHCKFDITD